MIMTFFESCSSSNFASLFRLSLRLMFFKNTFAWPWYYAFEMLIASETVITLIIDMLQIVWHY